METAGLGRLNPSVVDPPRTGRGPEDAGGVRGDRSPSKYRAVHAFTYTEPGGKLELFTEPMVPSPAPGVVREAVLTTSVDARGRSLNRLRLLVHLEHAESLDLAMPARSSLVRVRRDGAEVAPIRSGSRLLLPAPGAGARRPIQHDPHRLCHGRARTEPTASAPPPRAPRDRPPLPVLRLGDRDPGELEGRGLRAGPDRQRPGRSRRLALRSAGPVEPGLELVPRAGPPRTAGARLRTLDDRLDLAAPDELTLRRMVQPMGFRARGRS